MQKCFLVLGKNRIHIYELLENSFALQRINGNPFYEYTYSNAEKDIQTMLEFLCEEFNLASFAGLELYLLENENQAYTETVINALNNVSATKVSLNMAIKHVLKKIVNDKNISMQEYGINFDGVNYKLQGDEIITDSFDLLAYTIKPEVLVKYLL